MVALDTALLVSHVDGQCNIDGCTGGACIARAGSMACRAAKLQNRLTIIIFFFSIFVAVVTITTQTNNN